jgi:hypothetical protein
MALAYLPRSRTAVRRDPRMDRGNADRLVVKVKGTNGAKINGTKGAGNLRSGNDAGKGAWKLRLETPLKRRLATTLGDAV